MKRSILNTVSLLIRQPIRQPIRQSVNLSIRQSIRLAISLSACLAICLSFVIAPQCPAYGQNATYRVGPKDILNISVWEEPDLTKEAVIDQDGTINYPLLGTIQIAGMSVKQIDTKITHLLAMDYLVNPEVDVTIKEYNSQKVLVLGEIKKPGLYMLTGLTYLLEIISRAGGLTENAGNQVNIYRAKDSRPIASSSYDMSDLSDLIEKIKPVSIDLDELMKKGDLLYNLTLRSEDVIIFSNKKDADVLEQKVYISGHIKKTGSYDYQKGLTALNLCIIAGGFQDRAAPNRAVLTRNSDNQQIMLKINLNKIKLGKIKDIQLQPGDRLHIPESIW